MNNDELMGFVAGERLSTVPAANHSCLICGDLVDDIGGDKFCEICHLLSEQLSQKSSAGMTEYKTTAVTDVDVADEAKVSRRRAPGCRCGPQLELSLTQTGIDRLFEVGFPQKMKSRSQPPAKPSNGSGLGALGQDSAIQSWIIPLHVQPNLRSNSPGVLMLRSYMSYPEPTVNGDWPKHGLQTRFEPPHAVERVVPVNPTDNLVHSGQFDAGTPDKIDTSSQ